MHKTVSHSNNNQSAPKLKLLDHIETGNLAIWMNTNGKYIVYGLLGLFVLLIAFYRFSNTHTTESEKSYLQASSDFVNFTKASQSNDPNAENLLSNLIVLMNSHPELHAAYDGALGQLLLNRNAVDEAIPFVTRTLKRTEVNHLSYYNEYASTTLLISEQKYQEALNDALILQEKMGKAINEFADDFQRSFGEELFALNLFRIAMLQQQLGDRAAELQSWQLWKQYAGLSTPKTPLPIRANSQAFRSVIQYLAVGNISLPDYIAFREKTLS